MQVWIEELLEAELQDRHRLEEMAETFPHIPLFPSPLSLPVLILAMGVSLGIKSWIEGGVIAGVVGFNILIGYFQELSAEKTMNGLRNLASPTARVIRNGGNASNIAAGEVVPGDIVELSTGDTVPADLRLLDTMNFETDEALLTGESLPVAKDHNLVFGADKDVTEIGVGDRLNMAYTSSTVSKGRAVGIVTGTGMNTEVSLVRSRRSFSLPFEECFEVLTLRLSIPISYLIRLVKSQKHFVGLPDLKRSETSRETLMEKLDLIVTFKLEL